MQKFRQSRISARGNIEAIELYLIQAKDSEAMHDRWTGWKVSEVFLLYKPVFPEPSSLHSQGFLDSDSHDSGIFSPLDPLVSF